MTLNHRMDWRAIYDRDAGALFGYLVGRGLDRDRAEDVVHDVFAAAIATRRRVDRPRAYLFRAARRALPAAMAGDDAPAPDDLAVLDPGSDVDVEAIHRALAALPAAQRDVVVLRVWHGMTAREAGEALGVSEDTVGSRWRYGIDKLRRLLKGALDT